MSCEKIKDDIFSINYSKNKYTKKEILKNIFKIVCIMCIATIVALFFKKIDLNESNIILIFLLGVLFSSIKSEGYLYGILASIIGVLSFNFFFTEPYYTFLAYRADYPITFIIMLISSIITSTLTSKIKKEVMLSNMREQRIIILYKNIKNLLKSRNKNEIVDICNISLMNILNKSIATSISDLDGNLNNQVVKIYKDEDDNKLFKSTLEIEAFRKAFDLGRETGINTDIYQDTKVFNYPIKGQNSILGVIGVACSDGIALDENEKILLESIATQVALAIERENLFEKTRIANLNIETERLRSNLLRSISHDLRTPITGIIGSSSVILENYKDIDEEIKKELINNIYDDASWLSRSIENVISITRVDEDRLEIKKSLEVVEEIVGEAIHRVKRFSNKRKITVELPDEVIMVNVDGLLIEQVIMNLIDNAIRHTPENLEIKVKVSKVENYIQFEVEDQGSGLKEEDLPHIFDRFYTKSKEKSLEKRGIGLGLAICKSIVEAHKGDIKAFNNKMGGATFRFKIPYMKE